MAAVAGLESPRAPAPVLTQSSGQLPLEEELRTLLPKFSTDTRQYLAAIWETGMFCKSPTSEVQVPRNWLHEAGPRKLRAPPHPCL